MNIPSQRDSYDKAMKYKKIIVMVMIKEKNVEHDT